MKKEVIPSITPKATPQKVGYKYVGDKEKTSDIIGKAIPKQLIPTKRVGTIFGFIILAVMIFAVFQFPFGSLMSGNIDVTVDMGIPIHFLEFKLTGETALKPLGLIIDLLLYLLLAYAIDISISLIIKNPLLKSKKELKGKPAVFQDRKPTLAEKVTEKIVKK